MAGRPKKQGAEWFSHDVDARNNRKIKALENKFGLEGYAIYFKTLELMAGSESQRVEFSEEEVLLVAGDFGTTPETLSQVWAYCILLKLFQRNDLFLFSLSLKDRLKPLFEKREKDRSRRRGNYRSDNSTGAGNYRSDNPEISSDNSTKYSIGKEKKEEEENINSGKKEDQLQALQIDLIARITKNHSERNELWKLKASQAGKEIEELKLAFINKAIRENYSFEERALLAGFDGYLNTTVKNKQNETRTPNKSAGKLPSAAKRTKDTSEPKSEKRYSSGW